MRRQLHGEIRNQAKSERRTPQCRAAQQAPQVQHRDDDEDEEHGLQEPQVLVAEEQQPEQVTSAGIRIRARDHLLHCHEQQSDRDHRHQQPSALGAQEQGQLGSRAERAHRVHVAGQEGEERHAHVDEDKVCLAQESAVPRPEATFRGIADDVPGDHQNQSEPAQRFDGPVFALGRLGGPMTCTEGR